MPEVLDVLSPWPVVTTLVCYLGVGDLLNLSRSSSDCRAVLHGFPFPRLPNGLSTASSSQPSGDESNSSIRKDIFIGEHQTPQWKVLKGLAQLNCTEPNHKKGSVPKPCRYCSMPVCEACIVKVCSYQALVTHIYHLGTNLNSKGILCPKEACIQDTHPLPMRSVLGKWKPSFPSPVYLHPAKQDPLYGHPWRRWRGILQLRSKRWLDMLQLSRYPV